MHHMCRLRKRNGLIVSEKDGDLQMGKIPEFLQLNPISFAFSHKESPVKKYRAVGFLIFQIHRQRAAHLRSGSHDVHRR